MEAHLRVAPPILAVNSHRFTINQLKLLGCEQELSVVPMQTSGPPSKPPAGTLVPTICKPKRQLPRGGIETEGLQKEFPPNCLIAPATTRGVLLKCTV